MIDKLSLAAALAFACLAASSEAMAGIPIPGSAGAPSPEVNALLGLALASGTVAFLRRKKKGKDKSAA